MVKCLAKRRPQPLRAGRVPLVLELRRLRSDRYRLPRDLRFLAGAYREVQKSISAVTPNTSGRRSGEYGPNAAHEEVFVTCYTLPVPIRR